MENTKRLFWGNIYIVLALRLLLVIAIFGICRLLFYTLNHSLFPDIGFWYMMQLMLAGLRFDLSAILYLNTFVILLHLLPFKFRYSKKYQQVTTWIFYIFNIPAIITNLIDAAYFRFTLRRTTFSVIHEFKNDDGFGFVRFIWEYWYITLLAILTTTLLVIIFRKIRTSKPLPLKNYLYYPLCLFLMAIFTGLTIAGMRGGFTRTTRPITLSNASQYIRKPEHRAIVLNTPFSILQTIDKPTLEKKNYFSDEELHLIFNAENTINCDSIARFGELKGRNVILIIWESFSREWVGALNKEIPNYNGYTPFIDSLITKSYVFERAYANGYRSIDAMPSVLAGIPPMQMSFILSLYSGNKVNSLASLLKKEGYSSAFFHGAPNGSMGFQAFTNQCDYDSYLGMSEFSTENKIDRNVWGIWDEPFLMFMEKEINQMKEPFLASVFTLTSHDPYTLPKEYEGVFPKGKIPIHPCIGYVDNALKIFFEKASKEPWFNNTLFIITADHAVSGALPEYLTTEGSFAIPIIFYAPQSQLVGHNDSTVVQQTDILPTTLTLLGFENQPVVAFGSNMFDDQKPHFAVTCPDYLLQITQNDWILQFQNEKVIGFYNFKNDRLMKHNRIGDFPEKQTQMEQLLKAFIQEYNNRMIEDELTKE